MSGSAGGSFFSSSSKHTMYPFVIDGPGFFSSGPYVQYQFDETQDDFLEANFGVIPDHVNLNTNPILYFSVRGASAANGNYDVLIEVRYKEDGEEPLGSAEDSDQSTYAAGTLNEQKTFS